MPTWKEDYVKKQVQKMANCSMKMKLREKMENSVDADRREDGKTMVQLGITSVLFEFPSHKIIALSLYLIEKNC